MNATTGSTLAEVSAIRPDRSAIGWICGSIFLVLSALLVVNIWRRFARNRMRTRSLEMLAEAKRLETVGGFAGGIAHEFNNHLTPIHGYLELALDALPPDHPCYEGLMTALDRVIQCTELVSEIQSYGRKSVLIRKTVDLTSLLPSVVNMARAMNRPNESGVHILHDWPDHLPPVSVDKALLRKGLQNLLRNAYDAMPGGGTLRIEARDVDVTEGECRKTREATPGKKILVRISDTGVGIRTEFLQQVMDPFFTTHGRATARGMGLAMVHGMMAQHGGWMAIRSQVGRGASVELFFPVSDCPEPANLPRPASSNTVMVMPAAEAGRLLVADDDPFIREVVRSVFQSEGWIVDEAKDFDELCLLCLDEHRQRFDAIVMDLIMPGSIAEEAIQRVLRRDPDARILVMSGLSQDQRIDAMIRTGGVEFIPKPFSAKEILQRIDRMMAGPPRAHSPAPTTP